MLNFIGRRFEKRVNLKVELVEKEDLDLANHLSGLRGKFIKLTFDHVDELQVVLKPLRAAVNRNKKMRDTKDSDLVMALDGDDKTVSKDLMDEILVRLKKIF